MHNIATIIPVYGQNEMYTYRLMEQIANEGRDYDTFIIDNKGDYNKVAREHVFKTGSNLRWTKGTNYGLRIAYKLTCYDSFLLLNNDVRLSRGFYGGLDAAVLANPSCGVLAPLYDDVWEHQRPSVFNGTALAYIPIEQERSVKFVDGTAMLVTRAAVEAVGSLDWRSFGLYGWGADFDYAYRAKQAGFDVMVTYRSYLNHFHQGTAKTESDVWNDLAGTEMEAGMIKKYGENWRGMLM